jgi:repressor LexA
MTTGENIKALRVLRGLTQRELADRVGVTSTAVSEWERGKNEPRSWALEALSRALSVSMERLLSGPPFDPLPRPIGTYTSDLKAPLYGRISAGTPLEDMPVEDSHWINPDVLAKHPRAFYLRVDGDSMNLCYPDESLVVVDPDAEIRNGDVVAVNVNGYESTIKRYFDIGNQIILAPESRNSQHTNQVFDKTKHEDQSVRLIGKVVWYVVPF